MRVTVWAVVVLAGCAAPNRDGTPGEMGATLETGEAGGYRYTLLVPQSCPAAALCLYVGGVGETEDAPTRDPLKREVERALLAGGYAVAASAAGNNAWGHPDAVAGYAAMVDHLRPRFGRVVILSQSMGGLAGLNLLARRDDIRDWYGIYPVCSLPAMWDDGRGRFAGDIRRRFGGEDFAGADPLALPPDAFRGKRLRLAASYEDTVVPRADHGDRLIGAVVVPCTGDHGDPSHFRPADVVEFFGCRE